MRQYIAAALMIASLPALADVTPVTPPAAPTIPVTATVSPNATAALAEGSTNSVFINQSGENPNVNIEQTGAGNKLGTQGSPVLLNGRDQVVITKQVGSNNSVALSVTNDTTGNNVGATTVIQQIGNMNTVDAACGNGTTSGGVGLTNCRNANLNWKFTGNSNSLQFRGTGNNVDSAITVSGSSNSFGIDAVGNNHSETLMVSGDQNSFNISQKSTGAAGSSVLFDLTGTANSVTVSQGGSVDNVLNVRSTANTGVWNIKQGNQ
jgi:hypothetical protein